MITDQELNELWQAFCTLSDAQEAISRDMPDTANDLINHAKAHLDVVLQANDIRARVFKMPLTCTLAERG